MLPTLPISIRAAMLALGLGMMITTAASMLPASAWAQDDDDDAAVDNDDDDSARNDDDAGSDDDDVGGDDDDDDDDRVGVVPRRVAAAPETLSLPDQADDQIVVQGLDDIALAPFIGRGFSVLAESRGRVLLQLPAGLDVAAAVALVGSEAPAAQVAPNAYYRSQAVPDDCEGAICDQWAVVDWPPASVTSCRFEPYIGLVDTGINTDHAMLAQARLTLESVAETGAEPSERKHGTAVAAMFVGDPESRVPGLMPAARLMVVDPFGRVAGDERSDVFALAEALDRLGAARVDVASLSLAGPDNVFLADAISRLQTAGIPVVAAVGNAGPRAAPMFPAAYPNVVAVTAVDGGQNVYRRAVQGDHVSFAAPGVGITTAASISGVRPQTGTSFAVPFVTTALAAAMAGGASVSEALAALAAGSVDLGEPGRDAVFGWGLVQIPSPC